MEGEQIKVLFDADESGWAELLADGTVKVWNLPLSNDYNVCDICEVVEFKGRKRLGRVVSREFEKKIALTYPPPHKENFQVLRKMLVAVGCVVEGLMPGHVLVACKGDVDPLAAVGPGVGLYQVQPKLRRP